MTIPMITNAARLGLALSALALGCAGCGETAANGPTESDQQKVNDVSKDLVTKYGYPTAKGPQAKPPSAHRRR